MKKAVLIALVMLLGAQFLSAQEEARIAIYRHSKTVQQGSFSFIWGWNRGWFTKSDIHFTGKDYNFTLSDVPATDRQSKLALDPYFHPLYVTIPQTNTQLRYNFRNLWSLSLNVDHMKYVIRQNSIVPISGYIGGNGEFKNDYTDQNIEITKDFLLYEHTDGLNFVNVELSRYHTLWNPQGGSFEDFALYFTEGVGVGFLLPKTNATLLDKKRHDEFHLAGYGIAAKAGVMLAWKRFFVQTEAKGGYLNMPDIRTTDNPNDKASQHFGFLQSNLLIGASFTIR